MSKDLTTYSMASSVQKMDSSAGHSLVRSLAGRSSQRGKAANFSNKLAEELQDTGNDEVDQHFRDSIYNFNKIGSKAKVRCKFFDRKQAGS